MSKMNSPIRVKYMDFFIVSLIGMCAFFSIYGFRVVNPTYVDWLFAGGADLTQEYLGWKAFRMDEWKFPLGLYSYLTSPSEISIMYTDSLPLLALFFKLFRSFLPDDFQYLGAWGLACFVLMEIFAYRILSKFTHNRAYRILASSFFLFSSTLLQRMFVHTPLAGQWIILFAIDASLTFNRNRNTRSMLAKVAVLGCMGIAVHSYYILICGILIAGEALYELIVTKKLLLPITFILEYCLSGLLTLALLGGFYDGVSGANAGLGYNSFNLNALINPQGFSRIFKDLPLFVQTQGEGMAYLGAGIIFLMLFSVVHVLSDGDIKGKICNNYKKIACIAIVFLVSLIIAASQIITWNDKVIAEFDLPSSLYIKLSVFRCTGRVAWIIMYGIILLSLVYCVKYVKKQNLVFVVLIISLFIQVYDFSSIIAEKHNFFANSIEYHSSIDEDNECIEYFKGNSKIENVVIPQLTFYEYEINKLYDITQLALNNDWKVNTFYFARPNTTALQKNLINYKENPTTKQLFICPKEAYIKLLDSDLYYYDAGNYYLGYVEKINSLEEVSLSYNSYVPGTKIVVGDEPDYNGDKYIASGISYKEKPFAWTNDTEMHMGMLLESDAEIIHGQIDYLTVYNDSQNVRIFVNNVVAFSDIVDTKKGTLDFYFQNPGRHQPVVIKMLFPDCDSPANRGESTDDRLLCLGIREISFTECCDQAIM